MGTTTSGRQVDGEMVRGPHSGVLSFGNFMNNYYCYLVSLKLNQKENWKLTLKYKAFHVER